MSFVKYDRYVDRHARSFTERLQGLCRMPSVAARGTGMRAIAEAVEQLMQRVGIGTRSFRMGTGYPIIYGECGSGSRSFVVYGHYDVQPVGQLTEWSVGPFAATIVDGKLYARGAANSKGDLIARLAAVEAYQKSFGKLPVALRFIIEGEDGLGSPSLYRFTNEHADLLVADGCIWDEGYRDTKEVPVVSLGFKGITFLELRAHGARTDLHSKWGAIVPNPAWRLVQALATITSPKGVITVDGFSSHIAPISEEDSEALESYRARRSRIEAGVSHWGLGSRDEGSNVGEGAYLWTNMHNLRHSNRAHGGGRKNGLAEHGDGPPGLPARAGPYCRHSRHALARTFGSAWF